MTNFQVEQIAKELLNDFSSYVSDELKNSSMLEKLKYLINQFNIYLDPVVSYTTRAKRDNETEGVEHYFISKEIAKDKLSKEQIIAYTKIGEIEYFASVEALYGSNIYIIDPNGVKYLKENNPKLEVVSIYISIPYEIREERCSTRSDYETAFKKRYESENEQFLEFEQNARYDYLIENIDLATSVYQFLQIIFKHRIMFDPEYDTNTLFLVIGRTGSGKDTVIKEANEIINFIKEYTL